MAASNLSLSNLQPLSLPSHSHHHQPHSKKPYSIAFARTSALNPLYSSNPLVLSVARIPSRMSGKAPPLAVKSSLIDPDGGSLVELVVPEAERAARRAEAAGMPAVRITRMDLEWMHVLSEGWASPLRGFMREEKYLQCLHFNCLRMSDGSLVNMSLPLVLVIGDDDEEVIGRLVGPGGDLVAILRRIQIYKHNKEERIARSWGTAAPGLPYAETAITSAGNWLIGGDLEVL